MKEFIVNLDYTTRQQVTVLADTAEDATLMVHTMLCHTNTLNHIPTVSTGCMISCKNVTLALPTICVAPPISTAEPDAADNDGEDQVDLVQLLCNVREKRSNLARISARRGDVHKTLYCIKTIR